VEDKLKKDSEFRKELKQLVNKNNMENGSNTPDFILADFMADCLAAFDSATNERINRGMLAAPISSEVKMKDVSFEKPVISAAGESAESHIGKAVTKDGNVVGKIISSTSAGKMDTEGNPIYIFSLRE